MTDIDDGEQRESVSNTKDTAFENTNDSVVDENAGDDNIREKAVQAYKSFMESKLQKEKLDGLSFKSSQVKYTLSCVYRIIQET